MSGAASLPARALGWWRLHVSFQFGVACLAAKFGTEMLGLDWSGLSGFAAAASPALDLLTFFPACIILFDLANRLPGVVRTVAVAACVALIAVAIVADLLTLEFFHVHVASVLPVLLKTHALSATGFNRLELFPAVVVAAAAVFVGTALLAFGRRRAHATGLLLPASLLLLGYVASANRDAALQAALSRVSGNAFDYAAGAGDRLAEKPLHAAPHVAPVVRTAPPFAPSTIVVFINESLPGHFASSADPRLTLFDEILGESGLDPGNWQVFSRAFTNSSTTDISMPSLMTGADPTAGTEEVETLPFLYAMAKSRGYTTGFFTSQDYIWAQLRTYFTSDQLDTFLSSDVTRQPTRNLLGIDDIYVAQRIAEFVRAKGPDGRLFLVLNNNALHVPYQIESMIAVPGYAHDAKIRAAFIIEQFYSTIYQSLRDTGRLKDSLIIVTSDHGEMHPDRKRDVVRLDSHYDEVVHVPFAVYLPRSAPAAFRERLAANRDRTIANMDIAPTLMDALGLALPGKLRYPGFDLFATVPHGRVSISVTNNQWKPWHLNAFGLACDDDRLVYHQKLGLMYFNVRSDPDERHPITSGPKFDSYRAFVLVHPELPKWLNGAQSD